MRKLYLMVAVVILSLMLMLLIMGTVPSSLASKGLSTAGYSFTLMDNRVYTTTDYIDICSQHAQVCPVEESSWAGEVLGWQTTGKRWHRDINTPAGIEVMWEWSFPYAGSNLDYVTHRENPYADFSHLPDDYPIITGTPSTVYDWERWAPVSENYKLHQFGKGSEQTSPLVGDVDCQSGVYFPVIDHKQSYAYTPMSVTRKNECIGGGYIASHLVELWGEPLSVRRLEICDNEVRGIPADQSKQGNIICKLSPYVGVVNQRYVQGPGPTPEDKHIIGCEYAVYAWGWKKPEGENLQGKDYAEWFRNGELRLTRWLNLSNETMEVPAPDNHTWWNSQCEAAWHQKTNWLYNGIYRVGASIYSETLKLPTKMSVVVTSSGGYLTSTIDGTKYYFPSDTFTGTSIVTHTILSQSEMDFYEDVVVPINPGSATFLIGDRLRGIHHFFELTGVYGDTHLPSKFTQPCSVTIHYTDNDIHGVAENTLMLYYKNSDSWKVETSTHVFTENNTIVAQISNFSLWGVFGRTYRVYLPLLLKELVNQGVRHCFVKIHI